MIYKRGDIVILPFPFITKRGAQQKARPASTWTLKKKIQETVDICLNWLYIGTSSSATCRRSNGAALLGVASLFKFLKLFNPRLAPLHSTMVPSLIIPDKVPQGH
jgi:hypothetical protein